MRTILICKYEDLVLKEFREKIISMFRGIWLAEEKNTLDFEKNDLIKNIKYHLKKLNHLF